MDSNSPLNILKKGRKPAFLAKFLRRDKEDTAEVEDLEDKKISTQELGYIEDQKEVEELVKRNVLSRIIHSFRDGIWTYPNLLEKIAKSTRPFSFILVYAIVMLLVWQGLQFFGSQVSASTRNNISDTYIELAPGRPGQLNPLFISNNPVDQDIRALVFNKIITIDKQGNPQPSLAESWAISNDNKSYTFFLRKDVKWHDGEQFDADDVVFTFKTVQNEALRDADSYYNALNEVEVEKIDEFVVKCNLKDVNALFMENISFEIVPQHILKNIPLRELEFSDFSTFPIGTGPYKINSIDKSRVLLRANENYFKGNPKIRNITFKFFENNEQAASFYEIGQGHAISQPTKDQANYFGGLNNSRVYYSPLIKRSRVIYFNVKNSSTPVGTMEFRQALSSAIDRDAIIKEFVGTGGKESMGPVHQESWAYTADVKRYRNNKDEAKQLLDKAGWKVIEGQKFRRKADKEAAITLTYFDTPIIEALAERIKSEWESVGVKTILVPKTHDQLSQEIIPTRGNNSYEAMLYEIEGTIDPDSYNFWHSSKIEDPGLNISNYEYERVDILTERARRTLSIQDRKEDYALMQRYILRDVPIIYLYHPHYYFVTHESVIGPDIKNITIPSERFWNIETWEITK